MQPSLVDAGGCSRRRVCRRLHPGLALLLEDTLAPVEVIDAFLGAEAGYQESVAFFRQFVHDVIHRGVGARDDADRFALRDERCNQVEDRLCFPRAGWAFNDRDLPGEGGSDSVALVDVGVEGHDEAVARARFRGAGACEERFERGPSRRLPEPFPYVGEDRFG